MPASNVPTKLTPEALTYLRAVLGGLLQGPTGKVKVNPHFRDLVNGVYQVLAGGTVDVNVTQPGVSSQVKAYKRMETESLKSSNKVNEQHAYPIRVDI